jgi:isopenicillin-N N-acyltransferase-like protein
MKRSLLRLLPSRLAKILSVILALAAANALVSAWMLERQYDFLKKHLQAASWPLEKGGRTVTLEKGAGERAKVYRLEVNRKNDSCYLTLDVPGQEISPLRLSSQNGMVQVASPARAFEATNVDAAEIQKAAHELAAHLPSPGWRERMAGALVLRPFLTGVRWNRDGLEWRIHTSRGTVWIGRDALPCEADLRLGNWRAHISPSPENVRADEADVTKENVPADELGSSLAEVVRMAGSFVAPLSEESQEIRRSGSGWIEVRNGHRQMFLEGTPYEIGRQHGSLDPEGVRKVCRRLVYGVGLLYSFKKGEWFPKAARELIERQRPYIDPVYFEEMRGLADGAGLPLDLIQMANIFPEFFHCSGAALMGEATKGGELLHARVLDYMVGIGLQDHAAVMAISRPGVNRFVTVGYLGFIGSVTGMNEKQVAIGEMGGDGQGDWDGIPMSLLIRQALEKCHTLQEVEIFMRESPRTCEYYYVISDGKGPSALGVAATPKKFETFGPGVWHERLTKPVKDAVLLSGPGRYEALAERVRQDYGTITRDDLIEIIKRPVAMKSNLHNVIFQPQSLRLSVADATRDGPACDQAYRTYTWDELFSAAPSR